MKQCIQNRKELMTTNKSKCNVWPAGDQGFCKDTLRYHCLLYVAVQQEDFFVDVSCEDYNMITEEPVNLAIQCLTYKEMNPIDLPYDKELFNEIEEVAKTMFEDMKLEESGVSGAI